VTARFSIRAGFAGLLLFTAFVGLAPTRAPSDRPASPATAPRADRYAAPAATGSPSPLPDAGPYERAARALRERDCRGAQAILDDMDAGGEAPAGTLRLVSGFYAHACEDVGLAAERLAEPAVMGSAAAGGSDGAREPARLLEDWRLLILGEAAYAAGAPARSEAALDRLLDGHPASPLWQRALVTAIEHAREQGHLLRALRLIERGRGRTDLSEETAARVETLAWEIGTATGDWVTRARAARRLLALAPEQADALGVIELFRRPAEGDSAEQPIDWRSLLTPDQIRSRATALLHADRPEDALEALRSVPAEERDLDWSLLTARSLTEDRRAGEALAMLEDADRGAVPLAPDQAGRLAWERARAAADLASPLKSGAALGRTARKRMHQAANRYLEQVVRSGGETGLVQASLRRLFADRADGERFDEAMAALQLLRRIDPTDTTGAAYLWNKGWTEYQRRNNSGAIGYWSELAALYPDSREARSGRYWTARAFERLGHRQRSRELLEEVAAAPSTDFYRKHALAHLAALRAGAADGVAAPPPAAPPEAQIWPHDPVLARARLLSDLGLDALALAEIEGLEQRTAASDVPAIDPRARNALTGLCLARQGKRRAAIPHLRRAFPVLGGPFQTAAPLVVQHLYYPVDFVEAVDGAADATGLPHSLVYGIIREESAFDVSALSHAGARGLMQLMPATGREVAHRLGIPFTSGRLDDPAYNVRIGAAYFARVLDMFDGRTELALAGYNAGPYRLKRLWRRAGPGTEVDFFTEALPIEESKNYVKRVILFANSYHELYGL